MPVAVARVDQGPSAVPSSIVSCAGCGTACWLSLKTGAGTVALAEWLGDARFLCEPCLLAEATRRQQP